MTTKGNEMIGKWSISTNEENYHGTFDTLEEAVAEGRAADYGRFWVGQCVSPVQPELLFDESTVESWLDDVLNHDDYAGEWAEGAVDASMNQRDELAMAIRPVIAAWLDRHKLRPTHWNVDPVSVRQIDEWCNCPTIDGVLVTGSACQVHGLPQGDLQE